MRRLTLLSSLVLLSFCAASSASAGSNCTGDLTPSNASNRIVELDTSLGSICIELLDDQAPITTQNFVDYLNGGDYDGTIFHRAIAGFVLQAGGFFMDATPAVAAVSPDPAIANEACTLDDAVPGGGGTLRCSVRGNDIGTLAMAKAGDCSCTPGATAGVNCDINEQTCVSRPTVQEFPRPQFVNSATSQWFINLADNRANLDNQNGGFTVFANVLGDGLAIANQIATLDQISTPYSYLNAAGATQAAQDAVRANLGNAPVMAKNLLPTGTSGCFDSTTASALVSTFSMFYEADPVKAGSEFQFVIVAGSCGTPQAPGYDLDDYRATHPDSMDPNCMTAQAALRAFEDPGGPFGEIDVITTPQQLSIMACAEIDESLAESRALMTPILDTTLVKVAMPMVVPEPGAGLAAFAALGSLAALARRREQREG